jgi:hypothetical protein
MSQIAVGTRFPWQRNAPARRERRTMWLLVLLCVAALFAGAGRAAVWAMPFAEDCLSLFGPWREWSKRAVWDGPLPLMESHIFGGCSHGQRASLDLYFPNLVLLGAASSSPCRRRGFCTTFCLALGG